MALLATSAPNCCISAKRRGDSGELCPSISSPERELLCAAVDSLYVGGVVILPHAGDQSINRTHIFYRFGTWEPERRLTMGYMYV